MIIATFFQAFQASNKSGLKSLGTKQIEIEMAPATPHRSVGSLFLAIRPGLATIGDGFFLINQTSDQRVSDHEIQFSRQDKTTGSDRPSIVHRRGGDCGGDEIERCCASRSVFR